MDDLIIAGCGGFGRETVELVRARNDHGHGPTLLGFIDDDPSLHGTEVMGLPVLGPIAAAADHPRAGVVITVGNPSNYRARRLIAESLGLPDERYPALLHPTTAVGRSVAVGAGSIMHAGVVATAAAVVGRHVVVMPQVVFTHDDRIGDFATFGAGARLGGRVIVEEGAYVGSGAMIREDLRIGAWSLIGMGSVVIEDVPPNQVWAGTPARFLRMATAAGSG